MANKLGMGGFGLVYKVNFLQSEGLCTESALYFGHPLSLAREH